LITFSASRSKGVKPFDFYHLNRQYRDITSISEKMSQKTEIPKKIKTTVYITEEDDRLLNEIFIKRLRERKKTDRSTLLCEGIKLLFKKEIGKCDDKEN
jgi:hypothetical protein